MIYLQQVFYSKVSQPNTVTVESSLTSPTSQIELSKRINQQLFQSLLESLSLANRARFLSVSACMQPAGYQWSLLSARPCFSSLVSTRLQSDGGWT